MMSFHLKMKKITGEDGFTDQHKNVGNSFFFPNEIRLLFAGFDSWIKAGKIYGLL